MKKVFVVMLVMLTVMSVFASGAKEGGSAASSGAGKLAVVTGTGGLGDQNLNDYCYAGAKYHEADGVKVDVVQPSDSSDVGNLQRLYAEDGSYSAVVCISFEQMAPLMETVKDYPDQRFIICDAVVDAPNVTNILFRSEETGFQLGVLAGLIAKDNALPYCKGKNTIGFVGGTDNDTINAFAAGYSAGAKLVNPDVNVLISYVGSYSDPTTAAELATSQYEQGADVVFACAGGSGLGVFAAAEKVKGYAFGIETNQNLLYPDYVIASGTRGWDLAVEDATGKALKGELASGTASYGISDGMIKAETEGSNIKLPQSYLDTLKDYEAKIAAGELKVPTKLSEV